MEIAGFLPDCLDNDLAGGVDEAVFLAGLHAVQAFLEAVNAVPADLAHQFAGGIDKAIGFAVAELHQAVGVEDRLQNGAGTKPAAGRAAAQNRVVRGKHHLSLTVHQTQVIVPGQHRAYLAGEDADLRILAGDDLLACHVDIAPAALRANTAHSLRIKGEGVQIDAGDYELSLQVDIAVAAILLHAGQTEAVEGADLIPIGCGGEVLMDVQQAVEIIQPDGGEACAKAAQGGEIADRQHAGLFSAVTEISQRKEAVQRRRVAAVFRIFKCDGIVAQLADRAGTGGAVLVGAKGGEAVVGGDVAAGSFSAVGGLIGGLTDVEANAFCLCSTVAEVAQRQESVHGVLQPTVLLTGQRSVIGSLQPGCACLICPRGAVKIVAQRQESLRGSGIAALHIKLLCPGIGCRQLCFLIGGAGCCCLLDAVKVIAQQIEAYCSQLVFLIGQILLCPGIVTGVGLFGHLGGLFRRIPVQGDAEKQLACLLVVAAGVLMAGGVIHRLQAAVTQIAQGQQVGGGHAVAALLAGSHGTAVNSIARCVHVGAQRREGHGSLGVLSVLHQGQGLLIGNDIPADEGSCTDQRKDQDQHNGTNNAADSLLFHVESSFCM